MSETAPRPTPPVEPEAAPSATENEPVDKLSKERLDRITKLMGERGRTALIATQVNKADQRNVITEAISLKTNEFASNHKLLTRFPVIGSVVKAGYASLNRRAARSAIKQTGDLTSAFEVLELDASESRVLNSDTAEDRAWQALENAGYDYNNTDIERVGSRLDQNESVEKMSDTAQQAIRQAFNEYYVARKAGGDAKELGKKFDSAIDSAIAATGEKGINVSSIKERKKGLEELAKSVDVDSDEVKTYLDQHLTLYKASMKEGIYTEQRVDGVMSAVARAGFVGGMIYIAAAREGRSGVRSAVGAAAGVGITGAAAGGIAGALRGVQHARTKLSEAETRAATTFTESPTPDGNAENLDANGEDDLNSSENPSVRTNKIAKIFGWVGDKKRKLTGEDKYIAAIEEKRDRKDAKVLIDELTKLSDEFDDANGSEEAKGRLMDKYAEIIARGRFSSKNKVDLIKYDTDFINVDDRTELEDELNTAEKQLFDNDTSSDNPTHRKIVDELLSDPNSDLSKLIQEKMNGFQEANAEANKLRARFIVRSALVDATVGAVMGGVAGSVFQAISAHHDVIADKISDTKSKVGNIASSLNPIISAEAITTDSVDGLSQEELAAMADENAAATGPAVKLTPEQQSEAIESINNGQKWAEVLVRQRLDAIADELESESLPDIEIMDSDGDGKFELEFAADTEDTPNTLYNNDGSLTDIVKRTLEKNGYTIEDNPEEVAFAATVKKDVPIDEYFSKDNEDIVRMNGFSKDTSSVLRIEDDGITRDGDGNIVVKVGVDEDASQERKNFAQEYYIEGEKLNVYIAGISNSPSGDASSYVIKLPVDPEGNVIIEAGSPAESLFDDNGNFLGSRMYLGHETESGTVRYSDTYGNGKAKTDTVTIREAIEPQTVHNYTITKDGNSYPIQTPEEITKHIETAAQNESVPDIGSGQKIYYSYSVNNLNVVNENGDIESVDFRMPEHHGGYNVDFDTYFSETDKDGDYGSGASIARIMLKSSGEDIEGLSASEIDNIFSEKIASGEISKGEILRTYLETMGQSPEAIVTTRVMLGDELEVDGDLVDTEEEINKFADTLSRAPAEEYDEFVNDTYAMFYEKASNGNMRLVDYTKESYDYTTWSKPAYDEDGDYNGILQHFGGKSGPTTGLGLVFENANGESIYDLEKVRKLWNLPDNYKLEYVADRLNCIQKTGAGSYNEVAETVTETAAPAPTTPVEQPAQRPTFNPQTPWTPQFVNNTESPLPSVAPAPDESDASTSTPEGTIPVTSPEDSTSPSDNPTTPEDDNPPEDTPSDNPTTPEDDNPPEDTPSDNPTTPEDDNPPEDTPSSNPAPKDIENATRIDTQIKEDIAQDIGTEEVKVTPTTTQEVEKEQTVTEKPAASSYEGTSATIKTNSAASGGESSSSSASSGESSGNSSSSSSGRSSSSTDSGTSSSSSSSATSSTPPKNVSTSNNNYSSNNGGTNSGQHASVKADTSGQAAANAAATPVSKAPSSASEVSSAASELGIE